MMFEMLRSQHKVMAFLRAITSVISSLRGLNILLQKAVRISPSEFLTMSLILVLCDEVVGAYYFKELVEVATLGPA